MQYYSPYNGYSNGETNFPYVPIPASVPPRSQIVGEGDVTSVTLPDGTLQLYFIPVSRPSCFGNFQWGPVPVWFIRTIPNLFPAAQPFASNCRDITQPISNTFFQNNAVENEVIPKYQVQFHNDKLTSSTDLRYFCQSPLPFNWYSKQSVETQADEPVKPCESCCKACNCMYCGRPLVAAPGSDMSIDQTDDKTSLCHRKVNKVRFSSEALNDLDKFCDNCKNKCNAIKRSTSDKSN